MECCSRESSSDGPIHVDGLRCIGGGTLCHCHTLWAGLWISWGQIRPSTSVFTKLARMGVWCDSLRPDEDARGCYHRASVA